jgi:hypothetical protein
LSEIRTPHDNARDPLDAIRALDPRLLLVIKHSDLPLLQATRRDLKQCWGDDASGWDVDGP